MAFESLSDKLQNIFKNLRGKGRLSEADVKAALKEVKMALLEADVSFKVVKQFVKAVQERATGEDVLNSLTPGQTVIKYVNEELVKMMGETTTEIDKYLWAKMLYNCALNPLGVILNCTYGKLTENEYSKNIMDSIIDEIFAVIKKSEYSTLWDSADEYRKLFYSKLVPDTYNHYSSTYQDIQKKIKTEIDTLNGTVIRLGEKYGVDVSTNKIIYNLIKSIESEF